MSFSLPLVDRISQALSTELQRAAPGHCLRVDYLTRDDALVLCRHVRQIVGSDGVDAFVLNPSAEEHEFSIRPERAIEIRNRKQGKLCLFIPAGIVDAAASSLANSFAVFDLERCLQQVSRDLLQQLPEEVRIVARQALALLKGPTRVPPECKADYLGSVLENPSLERAGAELWHIGLIPDMGSEGFADRLEKNRECVRKLVRPARAQTSPAERLGTLGLRPGAVRDDLLAYLEGKRLRDSIGWLRGMTLEANRGRITFDRWTFESTESDLQEIEVQPLLDREGKVESYTKLRQPGGAGTQPVAHVAPRSRVTIKWKSVPYAPTNLYRWRAEMVPSRDEYAEEEVIDVELPSLKTSRRTRRATIPLDLELENMPVRAVQIRVVALDDYESELCGEDGKVIEGLSDEFWLSEELPSEIDSPKTKLETVPTLPFARLKGAIEMQVESIEEAPGQWSERDLHYYSITLNGRRTSKIGLSPILRELEERCLEKPEEGGRYEAEIYSSEGLRSEKQVSARGIAALEETKPGIAFLTRRKELFRLLRRQESRGLVETANWNTELSSRARAYAKAYRELLTEAGSPELRFAALTIDTLHLKIKQTRGMEEAVLVLPTHPLRILWYAAYTDLFRYWEKEILKTDKGRHRLLDLDLIQRVAPINCPAFVAGGAGSIFLFVQNLRFFWGIALPVGVKDPARHVADVARTIGFHEDEASLADLPPGRLAEELQAYLDVHPYLETLRLNVLNPGSGSFLAEGLRALYEPALTDDEEGDRALPPRLELFAHAQDPLPMKLLPLADLQRELYDAQPRGRRHHLAPLFTMAIRAMDQAKQIPGGDVNLSLAIDQLVPTIQPVEQSEHEDSSSFYGLLVRLLPHFTSSDSGSVWQHSLSFPPQAPRERHPQFGPYTNDLVDSHRDYLKCITPLLDSSPDNYLPAVVAELSPEDRVSIDEIHHLSDWVITLDRFFGVEFYDDPGDPNLSRVARKYLLDYAPEFLEGLGHRMLVTTSHREEVEEILARAMHELGFGMVEESVGEVLEQLKTISGRLALRVLGDDARAREAVSLGVVAAYLRARGELDDSILIPVDSHPELFAPRARRKRTGTPRLRCDLIRVKFLRTRLVATFIEVKSRAASGQSEELLNRIVDQIEATEEVFRDLFFRKDPVRLDHVLQRSRLVTILRFYLRRAQRYGLIKTQESFRAMQEATGRLESGISDLRTERWGFVVNLTGKPQKPARLRETEIRFLTARDLSEAGLSMEGQGDYGQPPSPPTVTQDRSTGAEGEPPPSKPPPQVQVSTSPPAESTPLPCEPTIVSTELGLTEVEQTPIAWKIGLRGSPHLFILGIPGQGKSWTVTRILCELAQQDLPAVVIDFHGQFGDPASPYARLASPIVLDAAEGLPFSPFEADTIQAAGTSFWKTNSFAVAEIFQYVCELGDIQRDVVYLALRDCYRDVGFEEGNVERLPTISELLRRLEEVERERGIRNVMPRCRQLLELGLFRDTAEMSFDLRNLLEQGLVVDVHRLGLETLQLAAGAFLLRKIYKDMFRWGEAEKLRLAIVLDEAHRLARDITLPKIMKEGRKFGIVVVVASQGLADYHPDVVGNAGTKVVFRTNFPMSKKVSGFLRAQKSFDLAAAIEQLDIGEAYVQTPEMTTCARVRMHPLEN